MGSSRQAKELATDRHRLKQSRLLVVKRTMDTMLPIEQINVYKSLAKGNKK
ncbi:TPA: hypothetical protein ACGL6F_001116 [Streptococcus agalactiae]